VKGFNMANLRESAGLASVASSTATAPSAIEIAQACTLVAHIAHIADALERMAESMLQAARPEGIECGEALMPELVRQVGWMADLATDKLGGSTFRGVEAQAWLLWPGYREHERQLEAQASAPGAAQ
jgi:hypothetical protein